MHNRRSGSTTVAMKAAKENGAILIAHNQEYARQIGGISQSELQRHLGKPQPILFDNGLLIKMCEDYRRCVADRTNQEILEWESEFSSRVQQVEWRYDGIKLMLNEAHRIELSLLSVECDDRVRNAIYISTLVLNPELTKRVPLNEMKFYIRNGFPTNY